MIGILVGTITFLLIISLEASYVSWHNEKRITEIEDYIVYKLNIKVDKLENKRRKRNAKI